MYSVTILHLPRRKKNGLFPHCISFPPPHMRKLVTGIAAAMSVAMVGAAAFAATPTSLFGDATVSDDAIKLTSDADPGYGGIHYNLPEGMMLQDFSNLSFDFMPESDDDCRAGSPRIQLNVDTDDDGEADANAFIYAGPSPNYTGCEPGVWQNTGEFIENQDACRFDTSQIVAGTQCNTYSGALLALSGTTLVGKQIVVDSGFAFPDGEQTVFVRNFIEDDHVHLVGPPTDVEQCKKGGFRDFDIPHTFRNQGECVSFVASGGKSGGNGPASSSSSSSSSVSSSIGI